MKAQFLPDSTEAPKTGPFHKGVHKVIHRFWG